jgi:hypothetical protein
LESELGAAAAREIVAFHEAVQRWFSGTAADGDFTRISQALAADFSMTTPDGRQIAEPSVSLWLKEARGSRGPTFRIWIENIRHITGNAGLAVLTYDECQRIASRDTRRHATAVFRSAPAAPLGVAWLRVHETWCAESAG